MSSSIIPTIPRQDLSPNTAIRLCLLHGCAQSDDWNNSKDHYQLSIKLLWTPWAWSADACVRPEEPDNQSSGKATAARLLLLHLHSDGATKTTMIVSLTQHIIFPFWGRSRRTSSRPESINACTASAVKHSDPMWSPGMIPYFQDIFGPEADVHMDRRGAHPNICNSF